MEFSKYHGLGNDFIVVDNRNGCYDNALGSAKTRRALCCRRTGIGSDGILELTNSSLTKSSAKMVYYNSNGNEGSFCGNGGRCFIDFALGKNIPISDGFVNFEACDGIHKGRRLAKPDRIELQMKDVRGIAKYDNGDFFVHTGSPHHVRYVDDVMDSDVRRLGPDIAWGELYKEGGSNVNFVQQSKKGIFVRTFERGVENETLACGTGLVAVAIVTHFRQHGTEGRGKFSKVISCNGGSAEIGYSRESVDLFTNITLTAPVCHLFDGVTTLS